MKVWFIILVLLIMVGFIIVSSYNLDLKQGDDRKAFAKTYTGYLLKIANNVRGLTQEGLKQDWEIENEINTSNSVADS